MRINPVLLSIEITHKTSHGLELKLIKDYGNGCGAFEIMAGDQKGKWIHYNFTDLNEVNND